MSPRRRRIEFILTITLGVFAFIATMVMWDWVRHNIRTPPIEWYGVEVTTPAIRVGGTLKLLYDAKVNEQCPSEVRAFLTDADGTTKRRWVTQGGYTPVTYDRKKIPVSIQITNDDSGLFPPILPGRYLYTVSIIRFCRGGIVVDTDVPSAVFDIVE